eukprot:s4305_g3.t1
MCRTASSAGAGEKFPWVWAGPADPRPEGSAQAWQLLETADRLNVGMTGISAMLSISERGSAPSKRSLLKELRLLLRCRGDVRPAFTVVAAARAAEAGDAKKALLATDGLHYYIQPSFAGRLALKKTTRLLLDKASSDESPVSSRIRRACGDASHEACQLRL